MRLPLVEVRSSILAHVEEKYPVPGLRLDLAEKKQTAQLKGQFTGDGLRRMRERRNYYAADTVCQFVAAFSDKGLDFVVRCDLTLMSVLYTEMVENVSFDQRDGAWVEDELVRLRSEI